MSTEENKSTTPQLDIRDGRATIHLSRPAQHNRLEPVDLRVLTTMFTELDENPDVRVLVITASGKSFSSGFHIGALDEEDRARSEYDPDAFEKMVNALERMKVPTIVAVQGGVYGGGTDLALACDFRVGIDGVRMFMPATRLGIVYYESGLRRYVTRLGLNNAKRMFMTAEPVDSEGMLEMGFLTEIVAADRLEERVSELAEQIAQNSPLAVSITKQALTAIAIGTFESDHHLALKDRCANSDDHREGVRAWAEKRKPVFTGR